MWVSHESCEAVTITVVMLLPVSPTPQKKMAERKEKETHTHTKVAHPSVWIVTHTDFMLWSFIFCGSCSKNVLYIIIYDYNCWYVCCRCVLSNCVLCDEVEVCNNSELKDCLIGSHHTVAAKGKLCPQSLTIYKIIPSELISWENQKSYVFHMPFYIMTEYNFTILSHCRLLLQTVTYIA